MILPLILTLMVWHSLADVSHIDRKYLPPARTSISYYAPLRTPTADNYKIASLHASPDKTDAGGKTYNSGTYNDRTLLSPVSPFGGAKSYETVANLKTIASPRVTSAGFGTYQSSQVSTPLAVQSSEKYPFTGLSTNAKSIAAPQLKSVFGTHSSYNQGFAGNLKTVASPQFTTTFGAPASYNAQNRNSQTNAFSQNLKSAAPSQATSVFGSSTVYSPQKSALTGFATGSKPLTAPQVTSQFSSYTSYKGDNFKDQPLPTSVFPQTLGGKSQSYTESLKPVTSPQLSSTGLGTYTSYNAQYKTSQTAFPENFDGKNANLKAFSSPQVTSVLGTYPANTSGYTPQKSAFTAIPTRSKTSTEFGKYTSYKGDNFKDQPLPTTVFPQTFAGKSQSYTESVKSVASPQVTSNGFGTHTSYNAQYKTSPHVTSVLGTYPASTSGYSSQKSSFTGLSTNSKPLPQLTSQFGAYTSYPGGNLKDQTLPTNVYPQTFARKSQSFTESVKTGASPQVTATGFGTHASYNADRNAFPGSESGNLKTVASAQALLSGTYPAAGYSQQKQALTGFSTSSKPYTAPQVTSQFSSYTSYKGDNLKDLPTQTSVFPETLVRKPQVFAEKLQTVASPQLTGFGTYTTDNAEQRTSQNAFPGGSNGKAGNLKSFAAPQVSSLLGSYPASPSVYSSQKSAFQGFSTNSKPLPQLTSQFGAYTSYKGANLKGQTLPTNVYPQTVGQKSQSFTESVKTGASPQVTATGFGKHSSYNAQQRTSQKNAEFLGGNSKGIETSVKSFAAPLVLGPYPASPSAYGPQTSSEKYIAGVSGTDTKYASNGGYSY